MQIFDVACFGTSLTEGTGNDGAGSPPFGSYVPVLQRALAPGKSSRVRCYNFGSGGAWSTVGMTNYLTALKNVRPRAVIIEFMMNDCALLSTADSTANHLTIINTLKALPAPPAIFLVTMNPVIGNSSSAIARINLNTYNDIYRSLSLSENVGLIDTYPNWAATPTDIPDGVHPTLAANIAKLIPRLVAALSPLIQ
ncbi:hypothetical protein AC629_40440 [Bradyrhizobium sp. NAS80.1]|uniref:SGNH/GDSL hydrolase family protein n=1 Tax=Bradyrhizobium sp. NAS80.1 TaxID=1680159 RepID=UPI00095CE8DD|nr:SGNH/GDSL hydrolase family protein [Bradyrhizobium sp. NAS80.1]OKO70396.1 hypothetical protein AC629_40440 [Bradyrhizobium sp. NAS80.1]